MASAVDALLDASMLPGDSGLLEVCSILHDTGIPVDSVDPSGDAEDPSDVTALSLAVENGSPKTCGALIRRGAVVDRADNHGQTPLFLACCNGHLGMVEVLLDRGADVDRPRGDGMTPLCAACTACPDTRVVELLLRHGARVDPVTTDGFTALDVAADKRHGDLCELLLSHGARLGNGASVPDTVAFLEGVKGTVAAPAARAPLTARERVAANMELLQACRLTWDKGLTKVCRLTESMVVAVDTGVDTGVDACVDLECVHRGDGMTPLMLAAASNSPRTCELLLMRGAYPYHANGSGETPLLFASMKGHLRVVGVLLAPPTGLPVGAVDLAGANGATPLFVACQYNHKWVAELLLDHGADVHRARKDGVTPLVQSIASKGDPDLVKMLLAHGAYVNRPMGHYRVTPLMFASFYDSQASAELLLAHGARINAASANGFTALTIAAIGRRRDLCEFLLSRGARLTSLEIDLATMAFLQGIQGIQGIQDAAKERVCETCGATPPHTLTMRCAGCQTLYCDLVCQKADERRHNTLCQHVDKTA